MMKAVSRQALVKRGFALVAAIGVLSLLMIFALSAAGSAEFTLSLSRAQLADRRLAFALEEGATLLTRRGVQLPGADAGTSTGAAALLPPRAGVKDDVAVSATLLTTSPVPLRVPLRHGDLIAALDAVRTSTGERRGAVYLVNSAGLRRAPILLQEIRP